MSPDFERWAAELAANDTEEVAPVTGRLCVCGCVEDRHAHYRAGDDCGTCGRFACPSFRPVRTITIDISVRWALVFIAIVAVIGVAAWVAVLVGAL